MIIHPVNASMNKLAISLMDTDPMIFYNPYATIKRVDLREWSNGGAWCLIHVEGETLARYAYAESTNPIDVIQSIQSEMPMVFSSIVKADVNWVNEPDRKSQDRAMFIDLIIQHSKSIDPADCVYPLSEDQFSDDDGTLLDSWDGHYIVVTRGETGKYLLPKTPQVVTAEIYHLKRFISKEAMHQVVIAIATKKGSA